MSYRRRIARACVVLGALVTAVAVALSVLPVQPSSCGSLLAPAFPHSVLGCGDAQLTFLPALVVLGVAGLSIMTGGVITLPQRRRSGRRRHP